MGEYHHTSGELLSMGTTSGLHSTLGGKTKQLRKSDGTDMPLMPGRLSA
jgi:hypothetical protein